MSRQGVKSFWSGSQYDGEMLKGKRHGRGTKQWPNGDIYEGIVHAWRIHESCWVRAVQTVLTLGVVCVAQASGGSTRRTDRER
jgi:hypothetical protein